MISLAYLYNVDPFISILDSKRYQRCKIYLDNLKV